VALFVQWVQEGNSLDGLSKTHLVSQDDVSATLPAVTGPVKAFKLKN
jgi:hypothetical protein